MPPKKSGKPRASRKESVLADDDLLGMELKTPGAISTPSAPASSELPSLLTEHMLDVISDRLKALTIPAPAKIQAADLIEFWLRENAEFDIQFPTVGVEMPFFFFADKFTIVVGVMDRIAIDAAGFFGCEWKSTKGTTRFWNEDKWLESIKNGHQISIYALALHEGFFLVPQEGFLYEDPEITKGLISPGIGEAALWRPKIKAPRIMVRAVTKESPPNIWPSKREEGFFEFPGSRLAQVRNALVLKGAQIRAARGTGIVPWEIIGPQCSNRYNHEPCRFLEKYCAAANHPTERKGEFLFPQNDPGSKAIIAAQSMLRVSADDPQVAIVSASSYDDFRECGELYRLSGLNLEREENNALDVGTGLHEGVAEFYRFVGRD